MAAGFVAKREQVDLKITGTEVEIPDNPYARLMYYLQCVFSCVPDLEVLAALLDHTEYYNLTSTEKETIIQLAKELSPGVMNGVIFHRVDSLPDGSTNEFITAESATEYLVAAASSDGAVIIGGEQVEARSIMLYTNRWMNKNYWEPLADIDTQRRALPKAPVSPKPEPKVWYTNNSGNQAQPSAAPPPLEYHHSAPQPQYHPQPQPTASNSVILVHTTAAPTSQTRATYRSHSNRKCCIATVVIIVALIIAAAAVVVPVMILIHK